MMIISMTATEAATPMATASRIRRVLPSNGPAAEMAAAATSGRTTTRASNWSTFGYPFSETSSWGSRVPNRLWAWTAKASSRAVTAASTTTSVSASA